MKRTLILSALVAATSAIVFMTASSTVSGQSNCGLQKNDTPVIFCETFDQPSAITNRSGQLNGTLWGVSRVSGRGAEWMDSTLEGCNGPIAVSPVGAKDVVICNGQLRESTDDNGDVSILAMYPKQPFDWANRTGTVAFDVTNDTTGIHGAWPEFWITDQPVPAPFTHQVPCDLCSVPRNAIGIRFAADRGSCTNGWRADSAIIVRNYVAEDRGIFENNTTGMQIREKGCASLSTGPNGSLNHVEIRINQNNIDVYASDAGSKTLRLINSITNANLSFSRGLVWIQDAHYNANKAVELNGGLPSQKKHTYTWDNVAFDGPATYRDLSYDVLDRNTPLGNGLNKLGWDTSPSAPANVNTLPMTADAIAAASSAYLLFNFGPYNTPTVFNYVINGNANTYASPLNNTGTIIRGMRSLAVPVPLNQLVPGPQNIRWSTDVQIGFSNVNIVLVAAAPVPGFNSPNPPSNVRVITE